MCDLQPMLALLATSKSVRGLVHEHGRGCIRGEGFVLKFSLSADSLGSDVVLAAELQASLYKVAPQGFPESGRGSRQGTYCIVLQTACAVTKCPSAAGAQHPHKRHNPSTDLCCYFATLDAACLPQVKYAGTTMERGQQSAEWLVRHGHLLGEVACQLVPWNCSGPQQMLWQPCQANKDTQRCASSRTSAAG